MERNYRLATAQNWRTLAKISEAEPPVVTRVVFSEADLRARAYVKGTLRGCRPRDHGRCRSATRSRGGRGASPNWRRSGTGSHIDAIPNAGLYDGSVGVLGGLEAIRALKRWDFRPRRSIELVMFTSEEPTRFGIGCLGSRMMARRARRRPRLARCATSEGRGLDELRAQAGFSGALESVAATAAGDSNSLWSCTSSRDRCWSRKGSMWDW